jgi:putative spermidine/putrescine transport system permease protein
MTTPDNSDGRWSWARVAQNTLRTAVLFSLYGFLLAPVLIAIVLSFDTQSYLSFPPKGFTFDWYRSILQNPTILVAFQSSLALSVVVAAVATVIGGPAALVLARKTARSNGALVGLVTAPLVVPTVVLGLALLLAFAPLGLTDSYFGLTIAYVGLTLPYVVRITMVSFASSDLACEEAARVLGASPFVTFRRVTLPIVSPGILAGFAMAFLISFDEALIALFLVGSDTVLLPVEIYKYVSTRTDPQIAALSVLLIALSLGVVLLVERLVGLRRAAR